MKYPQIYEGEWVKPLMKGYKLACCDCGLVHGMDFKIHGKFIKFRVKRLDRSTAAMRRGVTGIKF